MIGADEAVPDGFVSNLFSLADKRAVITGAGSGLGAAIAIGLAQAGAHVELVDIDEAGLGDTADAIRAQENACASWICDITSPDALAELNRSLSTTSQTPISVLVNSAGKAIRSPAEDFPIAQFDSVLALNLRGTFLACQVFGRDMLSRGSGSIINMASIGGFRAYPHTAAYLASKGAVVQLTKALALEWGPRGVRVNGIGPTLMQSAMTRRGAAASTATSDFIMQRMPRQRLGLPRELVGAAVFLASEASSLVNGHTLMCDDGYLAG